jgi:hypothetical protein
MEPDMRNRNLHEIEIMTEKLNERRQRRNRIIAVYQGDYVEIPIEKKEHKDFRKSSILLITVIVLFHIGAGCLNNAGMSIFFVAIPYVAAMIFALLNLYLLLFQLPKEKDKFRLGEVELLFYRTRNSSIFLGLALGACVLREIVYIKSVSDGGQLTLDFIFLALVAIEVFIAYFLARKQIQLLKKIRNKF